MGLRARRGNGPPGPKVKRKVLVAGGPRPVGVGERGQGLATTDGLSMRAGVPSGTQGDGPGRWPPRTRRRAAGPGSVSLGGARRRGPPDGPPANIELARPRPGAGAPRQAAKRPETGPDLSGRCTLRAGRGWAGGHPGGALARQNLGEGLRPSPRGALCFVPDRTIVTFCPPDACADGGQVNRLHGG